MADKKVISKSYLQKEVAVALNNAVLAAGYTTALNRMDEGKRARIGSYSIELMNLLYADVENGDLIAEELVYAFAGAALLTHCIKVQKTTSLPAFQDIMKRDLEING